MTGFVNAEGPQYLEDRFPNGRPPLEKAGVYMTDRDTVNQVERMKATTCLNPLHTALAVYGCLLAELQSKLAVSGGKNRPTKRTFTAAPAMTAWKRGRIRLPSLRRKSKILHTFYKSSLLDFTFRQYPESVDRRCPGKAPAFPQYASIEIMSKE